MSYSTQRDQQHPQEREDRLIVNQLLTGEATDYNLTELGRLRIRYYNFPGARELQRDLDLLLQRWGLTQEELFERTRQIHSQGLSGKSSHVSSVPNSPSEEPQDWS